jgi:hypothetical protein
LRGSCQSFKKYVLNHARPEGSIAKGYVTEEVIEFCVDFVDSIDSIGVPVSRHEGSLLGKGTIGRKACFSNDTDLLNKAHLAFLQQSTLVTPYIEEHKQIISSQNPTKTEEWVTRHYLENFPSWLSEQVISDSTIHPQLTLLARGPSSTIFKFQAYDINGYTFDIRDQDQKTTDQNSGVRIDAMENNNNKNSYYGVIEEIWELEYGPLNIPLFLCQWVKLTKGGIRKDQYGMTIVDLTKISFKDEPFVFAKNVHQVFYGYD